MEEKLTLLKQQYFEQAHNPGKWLAYKLRKEKEKHYNINSPILTCTGTGSLAGQVGGSWGSPWGKWTFVPLPWVKPQTALWGCLDFWLLNSKYKRFGVGPHGLGSDLAEQQDLDTTTTMSRPTHSAALPLPHSTSLSPSCFPPPSKPLHRWLTATLMGWLCSIHHPSVYTAEMFVIVKGRHKQHASAQSTLGIMP